MSEARIFDRGYRHYEGPRLGPSAAVRSIAVHSLRRVLGLRRAARAKALPLIVITIAYLPAIVIVGLTAIIDEGLDDLPTYTDYYGFIFTAILLFVTFVAPEALCPDRRTRLLGQYLAGPVSRAGYLLAKAASVLTVLLLVTLGPPLLLLLALSLEGAGPDGIDGFFATLGRIVLSGVVVSAFLTAISMAVSSLTDRKAFASVGFLVFVVISGIASGILYDEGDGVAWAGLLSLTDLPIELMLRIFAVPGYCTTSVDCEDLRYPDISTIPLVAAAGAWVAASVAVLWARYRRLEAS